MGLRGSETTCQGCRRKLRIGAAGVEVTNKYLDKWKPISSCDSFCKNDRKPTEINPLCGLSELKIQIAAFTSSMTDTHLSRKLPPSIAV